MWDSVYWSYAERVLGFHGDGRFAFKRVYVREPFRVREGGMHLTVYARVWNVAWRFVRCSVNAF